MKRFSRMKSTAYSPVSTNIMGQSLIYNHMSHHYRRLYNAKSCVDCSPPRSSRLGQRVVASSCLKTCSDIPPSSIALVDELIYDTKLGPAAYCSQIKDWSCCNCKSASPGRHHRKVTPVMNKKSVKTVAQPATQPAIMADRHARCFDSPFSPFQSPVPKVNAQSKVRDLKVYHPPRKKIQKRPQVVQHSQVPGLPVQTQAQAEAHRVVQGLIEESIVPGSIPSKEEWKPEDQVDDGISSAASSAGPWLQMPLYMEYPQTSADQKASSEESSRDSAYNGGVSSGGESRGPTPEHSPEKPPAPPVHLTPVMEARLKKQKEEALYIQFIHDITQDVLSSGIFSNKGLRQVFQRHINLNKHKLDMERMKSEVARLQIQLDMPDEEEEEEEDAFLLPSEEDIVLGWPSRAQDADKQIGPDSTLREKLHCYCSEKSVKMKVVEGLIMSPSDVIQSLLEMGFTHSMAEEVCQSLSDSDLQLTPKVCRDMSAVLCSEEDIATRGFSRHSKMSADRISKGSIGEKRDRPCFCELSEIRESSEFTPTSTAQLLKEVSEQFSGNSCSCTRESKQFQIDERRVSPRYSKTSAERILRESVENFIESVQSSRENSKQIEIAERRDVLKLSESSAEIILREIHEKLNGNSQSSPRESEQIGGSERRRSSQSSGTLAANLLGEVLTQFCDSPLPSQSESVHERRGSFRDSKTFAEGMSKQGIQSPRSSPRYPRTAESSMEQLRVNSHSSSRELKVCEVGEMSSETISEKRSPSSQISSGSSKKLDLIQETAEHSDNMPNCNCQCCMLPHKSRISKPKNRDMLVSTENECNTVFRTNSLGSTNRSAGAENVKPLQGTSTFVNKAEDGNMRTRTNSEKSENQISENLSSSIVEQEDLEDEDKSSFIDENASTADDVSEDMHLKQEVCESGSSSDSSISILVERLKDFTVDKDAFQPSSFPADKTELVPREELGKEHQS